MQKIILSNIAIILVAGLIMGCTNREWGTAGGAAVGGVAGNLLTGGSTAGTVVGAVGGGIIGNQLSK